MVVADAQRFGEENVSAPTDEVSEKSQDPFPLLSVRGESDVVTKRNSSGGLSRVLPWQDDEGNIVWSKLRIAVWWVIESQEFEMFMGGVIFCNIALIAYETDQKAKCFPAYYEEYARGDVWEPLCADAQMPLVDVVNLLFLVIYILECAFRFYVHHMKYFRSNWNNLDAFIVATGILGIVVESFVNLWYLRMLRIMRLVRAVRMLIVFPELYLLVHGLLSALKAIIWGALLILVFLMLFAIIIVEVVHPENSQIDYGCMQIEGYQLDLCQGAFSGVGPSILTLFKQIVAGDSWGTVTEPIIYRFPWSSLIFVSVLVIVAIGLMNLILAVIVDRAAEGRESDKILQIREKASQQKNHVQEFLEHCRILDVDDSGTVTLEELLAGYDASDAFQHTLAVLDIQRDDLSLLFKVLDSEGEGEVSYTDFCENFFRMKSCDTQTMLAFLMCTVKEVKAKCEESLDLSRQVAVAQGIQVEPHSPSLDGWTRTSLIMSRGSEGAGSSRAGLLEGDLAVPDVLAVGAVVCDTPGDSLPIARAELVEVDNNNTAASSQTGLAQPLARGGASSQPTDIADEMDNFGLRRALGEANQQIHILKMQLDDNRRVMEKHGMKTNAATQGFSVIVPLPPRQYDAPMKAPYVDDGCSTPPRQRIHGLVPRLP